MSDPASGGENSQASLNSNLEPNSTVPAPPDTTLPIQCSGHQTQAPVCVDEDLCFELMSYSCQTKTGPDKNPDPVGKHANIVTHTDEPTSYKDAMSCPEANLWIKACLHEIEALWHLGTFKETDRPVDCHVIGSCWTFKLKCGPDGKITLYKAQLVAKGYSEVPGIYFDETFTPALKKPSLLALLAHATHHDLEIEHMDIKSAFLNGVLKEEIYMEPLPGIPVAPRKVFHLIKTLYGLRQAPHAWYKTILQIFLKLSYRHSEYNYSIFIKSSSKTLNFITMYVDDLLLFSNRKDKITKMKLELG
jgi:Reverse transcriptase (RNA-dependent DNA polymerase)